MRLLSAMFIAAMAVGSVSALAQPRLTDQAPPWEEQDTAAPVRSIHMAGAPACTAAERVIGGCRRSGRTGHRASFVHRGRRNHPL